MSDVAPKKAPAPAAKKTEPSPAKTAETSTAKSTEKPAEKSTEKSIDKAVEAKTEAASSTSETPEVPKKYETATAKGEGQKAVSPAYRSNWADIFSSSKEPEADVAQESKLEIIPDQPRNFLEELAQVDEYWSPRIVGEVNGQYVKVAKLKGEFVWHQHDDEDELFQVVKGSLRIEYKNKTVTLEQGDFHIVPKGLQHNPIAEEECWIVLFESKSTLHTGDVVSSRTKSVEDQLRA